MDNLDKSLPVSEGAIDAEQEGKTQGNAHCLNCSAPLTGPYCGQCGQKDLPRRQGMGDLLLNFISSFFSFESKFFKTFGALLFKPGLLIFEYNEGKRERYYHPARMYVFLSFIFFLIVALIPDEKKVDMRSNGKTLSDKEKVIVLDSLATADIGPKTVAEYDSLQNAQPVNKRDGFLKHFFMRRFIELKERQGNTEISLWRSFGENLQDNIPKMIFFLLPVFALLLKLLYLKGDYFYSEHLVFSVFYYDFLFLVGSISMLFSLVSWLDWIPGIIFLYTLFYLYKGMRKVYQQSRFVTIVKFLILTWIFFFCVLGAFLINVLVTLMML